VLRQKARGNSSVVQLFVNIIEAATPVSKRQAIIDIRLIRELAEVTIAEGQRESKLLVVQGSRIARILGDAEVNRLRRIRGALLGSVMVKLPGVVMLSIILVNESTRVEKVRRNALRVVQSGAVVDPLAISGGGLASGTTAHLANVTASPLRSRIYGV